MQSYIAILRKEQEDSKCTRHYGCLEDRSSPLYFCETVLSFPTRHQALLAQHVEIVRCPETGYQDFHSPVVCPLVEADDISDHGKIE
jgi:hypothetical protein